MLNFLLRRPLLWIADRFSAAPKRDVVFRSLDELLSVSEKKEEGNNRLKVLNADAASAKFIVFSDQHKGDRSYGDDFGASEMNYLAALKHYRENGFTLIALGDAEELWKYRAEKVLPVNDAVLKAEAAFQPENLIKTFGNHDVIWKNKLDVIFWLNKYFTMPLQVYEGVLINLAVAGRSIRLFLTHGHQGDSMSDGNRVSTWIVAHIWMPLQRYLRINVNTPAKDYSLRNKHNIMMSDWCEAKTDLMLVTGHTHAPVFASGKYFEHPSNNIPGKDQRLLKPAYYNSGCCCFSDGDITGIEIEGGHIRLIKWFDEGPVSKRLVLEEKPLQDIMKDLSTDTAA